MDVGYIDVLKNNSNDERRPNKILYQGHSVSNDLDFDLWDNALSEQIIKGKNERLMKDYENEKIQIVAALTAWELLEAEPNKIKSLKAQNSFMLTRQLNWLKNSIDK